MGQIIFFIVVSLFILLLGGLILFTGRIIRNEPPHYSSAFETRDQDFFRAMVMIMIWVSGTSIGAYIQEYQIFSGTNSKYIMVLLISVGALLLFGKTNGLYMHYLNKKEAK